MDGRRSHALPAGPWRLRHRVRAGTDAAGHGIPNHSIASWPTGRTLGREPVPTHGDSAQSLSCRGLLYADETIENRRVDHNSRRRGSGAPFSDASPVARAIYRLQGSWRLGLVSVGGKTLRPVGGAGNRRRSHSVVVTAAITLEATLSNSAASRGSRPTLPAPPTGRPRIRSGCPPFLADRR